MGPQIRKLLRDDTIDHLLHGKEKKAWKAFQSVATEFLGNVKANNYKQLVANLLNGTKPLGAMSLKINISRSHLDFFPLNGGKVSDEHGEQFHQVNAAMDERYQEEWNLSVLADNCWNMVKHDPTTEYKRQAKKPHSHTE